MKVCDRTLNAWQTAILVFVLMLANKILVLPSLLFEGANIESVFVIAFLFLLELGLLFLFFKLKTKYSTESFEQILQSRFGKGVKVILYAGFMIFFLAKAVLLYNVTYIFFRNLIYKDTSNVLILFCFLPIINHLAICGLRVMGRTIQIFFPVVISILLFCLVVGVFGINSRVLWFSSPFLEVLKTGARHISPFGDIIFLFLIMDKAEIKKGEWKVVFSLFSLSAVLVFGIGLVFMLSYTYTSFMHPYAIFEIMSFVKEFGGLGRIDIIAMVAIIMLAYFHLAIYLKAFMLAFDGVFSKSNEIFSVISFNFAFVVTVIFFIINLETAVTFGEEILPFAEIFPYVLIPIFAIIALFWKDKKKGKTMKFQKMNFRNFQKKPKNAAKMQKNENIDSFENKNGPIGQKNGAKLKKAQKMACFCNKNLFFEKYEVAS